MKSLVINVLRKWGVKPNKLVQMFGVSRATIYRHLKKQFDWGQASLGSVAQHNLPFNLAPNNFKIKQGVSMGRAIDVDRTLDDLRNRVAKLENIVRGMSHTMSETKHIDLIDEIENGEKDAKEQETNNETDDKSSVKPNKRTKARAKKSSKS